MILFAGIPSEDPLRLAIEAAERLDTAHLVLNQRQTAHIDLSLSTDDGGSHGMLRVAGQAYPVEAITGIYARTIDADLLPESRPRGRSRPDAAVVARARTVWRLFDDWLDIAPARVVNRPVAMGSNMSKPYQAQLIAAAGLRTPETLVTNDPEAIRTFHAAHGRIVYKSVSAVRSIVRPWTPADGPDLAAVRAVPTQFQAFVPGENVRVHVVGDRVFATGILSDAIDYRYAERDGLRTTMAATDLPRPIEEACVTLAADLRLPLAGLDLKRTPDGEWYCFEVNPAPAYSYFEEHARQPIAEALVRFLAERS